MYIKREFIDKLLERANIVDVVSKYVALKKAGTNYKGLSPFVKERTPSFTVSPAKEIWKDFSSGKAGGVVNFIMEVERCSFPEAIEKLAGLLNEKVEYEDSEQSKAIAKKLEQKEQLRPVLKHAHQLYMDAFKNLPATHPAAIEVFQKRQYDADVVAEWQIGYAPGNVLYNVFKEKGLVKEARDLGLLPEDTGKFYDKYTDRIIYPIHDKNGLLIGLAGRDVSTDEKKRAKWINPDVNKNNILYNKSSVWFGMHKARKAIAQNGNAWLVEGYNDVIAWHLAGQTNTVASCGTAITEGQVLELRKLTEKVTLCFDPDAAGVKAATKHTESFIKAGFRVDNCTLPCDPDDFYREYKKPIDEGKFSDVLQNRASISDGFELLLDHYIRNHFPDEVAMTSGARELCKVIAHVQDDSHRLIYMQWIKQAAKIKAISTVKKWTEDEIKIIKLEKQKSVSVMPENYELPHNVTVPFSMLEADIKKYGLFMANNQIYMSTERGHDEKIRFVSVSNFTIEVLQHMNDEKYPMKLFKIHNVLNVQKIFDAPSESINSFQLFDNMVTAHGNFNFQGSRPQLQKLRTYLMDKMGTGRKIDVLGWQPDGKFWCWNNCVILESGEMKPISEHGVFVHNEVHYYIPSANSIYATNHAKFQSQKKFRHIDSPIPFSVIALKIRKVHREHAISALLFAVASIFQDIIAEKLSNFPILFLYGPGSSGKDELAAIVQSFMGIPQSAINLEGGVSTAKASVREFAQFRNGISQLSEFKREEKTEGILKALWDRRGYKRGNIESNVATEEVPIESSVILTGNDYPSQEPLILRTIWNEMSKTEFSEQEMKEFDELRDMRAQGLSGYSSIFMKERVRFEAEFDKVQRTWKGFLQEILPGARSRIINNLSILGATFEILDGVASWPFSKTEMIEHFKHGWEQQRRKLDSTSILNRFWDCFITGLRGAPEQRIQLGKVVSIQGETLYFNWTHVWGHIQMLWFRQYQTPAPAKDVMFQEIVNSGAFIEKLTHHAFSPGRAGVRTSAISINMKALGEVTMQDIIGTIEFQSNENSLFDQSVPPPDPTFFDPPATPAQTEIL